MTLIRIKVDPSDPSTRARGRIDHARVDATTEEDIARQKRRDALRDMARYVRRLRNRMNLGRKEFARRLGISRDTVREWEEGRRFPSGAACSLLRVMDRETAAFLRVPA